MKREVDYDKRKMEEIRLVLSGAFAFAYIVRGAPGSSQEQIIRASVQAADLLLKELEKP